MRSSVPIPTLKWGKRKARSQMCEAFTEDGKVVNVECDVMRTCIDDPEKGLSFLLDSPNQMKNEDGESIQILWERTFYPVCMVVPGKDPDLDKLSKQIYKEIKDLAINEQFDKANKDARMTAVLWCVSIFCATFIIIAGIAWLGG